MVKKVAIVLASLAAVGVAVAAVVHYTDYRLY